MKKVLLLFLAIMLVFSVSCSKENKTTETESETKTIQNTVSDEEALQHYIDLIKSEKAKSEGNYNYDNLEEFITLGEYKGLSFPSSSDISLEVSDEEAETYFEYVMRENFLTDDDYEEVKDGKVQNFDKVTIDYQGFVDGKSSDNMTDTDYELDIGSNSFIPGFENGLIGKKVGSTVNLDLQFSPYYQSEDVAGKKAVFKVTVKAIKRASFPEISIEIINELYNSKFESIEEVKAQMKNSLISGKESYRYDSVTKYLMDKVISSCEIKKYPDKEMEYYKDHFQKYYESYAQEYDVSFEEFLKQYMEMELEDFENVKTEYAENAVSTDIIVKLIADKEKIEISDSEIKAFISSNYSDSQYFSSLSEFIEYYTEMQGVNYFADNALWVKVNDFIYQNAVEKN